MFFGKSLLEARGGKHYGYDVNLATFLNLVGLVSATELLYPFPGSVRFRSALCPREATWSLTATASGSIRARRKGGLGRRRV